MTATAARHRPRRPPPVAPGDVIGVAALSSASRHDALAAGVLCLEEFGFTVRRARNLSADWEGFAGRDQDRLAGFHELVADPEVKAIVFARGGAGLLRVLPGIDWDLLAAAPKAYVGYSDLVPLLLQIVTRLGLICFHGPMVATDLAEPLDPTERASLLDALGGRIARSLPVDCAEDARPVEGHLMGGCLAMLVSTLGTPWFPRLDGSLLVLEDVHEPLYRIDRMLTQLRLSGKLRRVKGMILGHLGAEAGGEGDGEEATPGPAAGAIGGPAPAIGGGRAAGIGGEPWRRLRARSTAEEAARIMAWNLPCGHGRPNLTLPLGARARLDPEAGALLVLDDAPGAPT
jgi:muramoyltetrapeptide carboxypeptidase